MCEDPDVYYILNKENVRIIIKKNIWLSINLIIKCSLRYLREILRY